MNPYEDLTKIISSFPEDPSANGTDMEPTLDNEFITEYQHLIYLLLVQGVAKEFGHDIPDVMKAFQSVIGRKTGRNELCPCGSQKKYKKCCLRIVDDLQSISIRFDEAGLPKGYSKKEYFEDF